jgi:transposase
LRGPQAEGRKFSQSTVGYYWKAFCDFPRQLIINIDETQGGPGRSVQPGKVIAMSEHPTTPIVAGQAVETALGVIFADGTAMLPVPLLVKSENVDSNAAYDRLYFLPQKSGWMTTEALLTILRDHVLPEVERRRALIRELDPQGDTRAVLVWDGHSTHKAPEVAEMLKEAGIEVFFLPPHTSTITQPLDCGPFAELKRHLNDANRKYKGAKALQPDICKRGYFLQALSDGFYRAYSPHIIRHSFACTGLVPYNPQARTFPETVADSPTKAQGRKGGRVKLPSVGMAGADISFAQRLRSLALKEEAKKRRQAKKDAKVSTRGVAKLT